VEWSLESPIHIYMGVCPMMSLFTHMMIVAVLYSLMESHEALSYSEHNLLDKLP